MNSTGIFTLALGLKEPWEITDIEISVDQDSIKELNIHLGFKRGAKFDDEAGVSCSVHDTQKRSWRILTFLSIAVICTVRFRGFERVMARYD